MQVVWVGTEAKWSCSASGCMWQTRSQMQQLGERLSGESSTWWIETSWNHMWMVTCPLSLSRWLPTLLYDILSISSSIYSLWQVLQDALRRFFAKTLKRIYPRRQSSTINCSWKKWVDCREKYQSWKVWWWMLDMRSLCKWELTNSWVRRWYSLLHTISSYLIS